MSINLENLLLEKINYLIEKITGVESKENNFSEAIIRCINIRDRIPSEINWDIYKSNYLLSQRLPSDISAGLALIVSAAKAGKNLSPWLHNHIFIGRQDALMSDWGIQHYHLGLNFEENSCKRKRINRTSELLYAMHNEQAGKFYLIGIFDHKSFSEKQFLEIVCENWPELLHHAKIENIIDVSQLPENNKEIDKFRKAKINSAVKIKNNFYIGIGGGQTASGQSAKAVMQALQVRRFLSSIQEEINKNKLQISFEIHNYSIYLIDKTNNRNCQIL